MRILLTGSNGYIASSLISFLQKDNELVKTSRQNLNLKNQKDVDLFFARNGFFDVVIHTAVEGGSRLKNDTSEILDNNLNYYYNLLKNKSNYNKFIHFGSGAEIYNSNSYYGLSKKVIRESIMHKKNFFNIRIFGVFDNNELPTRFIKKSINNYINKKPIEIHEDKKMDFFYMGDLISLVDFYLKCPDPPKEIDCSYNYSYTLKNIAEHINSLGDHKVDINCSEQKAENYVGQHTNLNISYKGLLNGIQETFNNITSK
jgi:nucleoside-diphosphate-sugar epimerase